MSLFNGTKKTKAYKEASEMHELLCKGGKDPSQYLFLISNYTAKLQGVIKASLGKTGADEVLVEFDSVCADMFLEFRVTSMESRVAACAEALDIDFPRVSLKAYGQYDISTSPSEILADINEKYEGLSEKCGTAISVLAELASFRSGAKA